MRPGGDGEVEDLRQAEATSYLQQLSCVSDGQA